MSEIFSSSPTGVGQAVGGGIVLSGVAAASLGIGQIIDGCVNETSSNIPSGINEIFGMGADAAIDNGKSTFQDVGKVADITTGAFGGSGYLIEDITTFATVIDYVTGLSTDNSTNQENQSNTSSNTIEDVSEFVKVNGEHLSTTDSDYWNSLTDRQKQGYDEQRSQRFQEYIRDKDK